MIVKHDSSCIAIVVLAILCLALVADPVLAANAMSDCIIPPWETTSQKLYRWVSGSLAFYTSFVVFCCCGGALLWDWLEQGEKLGLARWLIYFAMLICIAFILNALFVYPFLRPDWRC